MSMTDSPARMNLAYKQISVALLTGGGDRPYALGLASELISKGAVLDVIGSDELDCPEFHDKDTVRFLNLRGDQGPKASLTKKLVRLSRYYARLICYAAIARPKIFHILWNNKVEVFDRTFLMLYYKLLHKKVVRTVHNVNAAKRDFKDSSLNRFTLRIQYRLCDYLFVHTEKMKRELTDEFGVPSCRIAVIPFGINNAVPNTRLSSHGARRQLGIRDDEKTILFFGNITPYKGLEYLLTAFQQVLSRGEEYRLIIAGRPNNCASYWSMIQERIQQAPLVSKRVLLRAEFVPDEETEVYFKAADVLVLPYRQIYQSGVLFLGYSFGLPVLVADVGSLRDEIVEGKTGFAFRPEDSADLARAIDRYFASDLFTNLDSQRSEIQKYARENNSWEAVGQTSMKVYAGLLGVAIRGEMVAREVSSSAKAKVNS